jgi:predicted DNA-binding transcriptional regulator AlpA
MAKYLRDNLQIMANEEEQKPHYAIREHVFNEKQAAKYMNMSVKTLQAWRFHCKGPRFMKLGRSVRYRQKDLDAFLNDSYVDPVA